MRDSSVRLGSLLVVLVLTAAVFAFVLSDNGSEPGAEAQSGLSAPAIRSAAVSSSGRLTVRFAHGQIWQHSFDFKIHQLRDSGGLKLFKRVTAQSSPMRTNVDLGSEYRVEGRTCSRGSCGGWSDLFEVEVPAAAPAVPTATASPTSTATPTATATATATGTATATATSTATPSVNSCHLLSDTVASTRSSSLCEYPKLQDSLPFFACLWNSTVLSNRRGQPRPYPAIYRDAFHVLIKTNGDKEPVVQFLENNDVERVSVSKYTDNVQARDVPVSILGELSELPQVIWVRKSVFATPAGSMSPGVRGPGDSQDEARTQADSGGGSSAALWHGADVWLTAVPGVDGSDVNVGIIDTSFNGFRDLQAAGVLPTGVPSYCDFVDSAEDVASDKLRTCETTPVPNAASSQELSLSHGARVAEAVMDIAPGAELYIARVGTREDLARAAAWMRDKQENRDVHVINASLDWPWEGAGDGDSASVIADGSIKTVATAVANKVVWVNAAGNWADEDKVFHWDASDGLRNRWHPDGWLSFAGGSFGLVESSLRATLMDAEPETEVFLRWGAEGGEEAELDLLVCDNEDCTGARRDISARVGGIETVQFEEIELEDWGSTPDALYLRVCRHPGGDGPDWLQLGINGVGELTENTGEFRTIGAPGESDSRGMLAVGAAEASMSGNSVRYELYGASGRGPTTDGIPKAGVVGVGTEAPTPRSPAARRPRIAAGVAEIRRIGRNRVSTWK